MSGDPKPTGASRAGSLNPSDSPAQAWDARSVVLLIEVDPLARLAISLELMRSHEITKVIEASDWESGAASSHPEEIAAVVLELQPRQPNPVRPLVDLLAALPGATVLVFSVFDEDEVQIAAMRAGARGFLSKHAGLAPLVPAVSLVMRGEMAVSPRLTMQIIRVLRTTPEGGQTMRPVRSRLTVREWEVLSLLGTGLSTPAIAGILVVGEGTVYSHVRNILRKLGVHTRAAAILLMEVDDDLLH